MERVIPLWAIRWRNYALSPFLAGWALSYVRENRKHQSLRELKSITENKADSEQVIPYPWFTSLLMRLAYSLVAHGQATRARSRQQ